MTKSALFDEIADIANRSIVRTVEFNGLFNTSTVRFDGALFEKLLREKADYERGIEDITED